jgi:hypothetical protein
MAREIHIGEQTVRVRASALALLYYKQAFKSDLLGDMVQMQGIEKDISKLDIVSCFQLIWAMAKADSYGKSFPSFEAWMASLGAFDLNESLFLLEALDEASDGFLGGGGAQIQG